ncbi:hypothetical protein [Kordiimonas gwangyangensis]|uniref:hypothetical protein n=1 Tax=Kordiimonas gwangyangensis TaxID=288022 RepID=UPI000382DC52|nr:hypothetical protein [Kordiimonas gwangyangensis]
MKSTSQLHQCPTCDRIVRGPGFFQHVRKCRKQTDLVNQLQHAPVNRYTISGGKLYHSTGREVGAV